MTPVKNIVLDFEKETAISRKEHIRFENQNNENIRNKNVNQTPIKIQNLFSEL